MNLTKPEILEEVSEKLSDYKDESGGIFNSSLHSLKKGRYYLLGTNPGGDPKSHKEFTIAKDIESFKNGGENLWEQICDWNGNIKQNIKTLLKSELNLEFPQEIFFTNLIFKRSVKASEITNFWEEAKNVWKVHKLLLKEINPEIIITIGSGEGNSPYAFLKDKLEPENELITTANYKNWKHKTFRTKIDFLNSKQVRVVGLAHLSYKIKFNDDVRRWLRG